MLYLYYNHVALYFGLTLYACFFPLELVNRIMGKDKPWKYERR
jgi:hypothetical protein